MTTRDHETEAADKVTHSCGATSSKCPQFGGVPLELILALADTPGAEQIPAAAVRALGERLKLGEMKHGKGNWCKGLGDEAYVIERLNHVIYHALKLIAKIKGERDADGDHDAAALIWGGMFAVEAVRTLEAQGRALITPRADMLGSTYAEMTKQTGATFPPALVGPLGPVVGQIHVEADSLDAITGDVPPAKKEGDLAEHPFFKNQAPSGAAADNYRDEPVIP